jgi:hypothetical protein
MEYKKRQSHHIAKPKTQNRSPVSPGIYRTTEYQGEKTGHESGYRQQNANPVNPAKIADHSTLGSSIGDHEYCCETATAENSLDPENPCLKCDS